MKLALSFTVFTSKTVDKVTKPSDPRAFIEERPLRFQRAEALHITIFYRDQIAGALGYNLIDTANEVGHIGY